MLKIGLKGVLFLTCGLLGVEFGWAQSDISQQAFTIGEINYFGYGGLRLDEVRKAMPWHVGDSLTPATFTREPVARAIQAVLGKPPTDVNVTCCDPRNHLEIFVGLPGSSWHDTLAGPPPNSNAHLAGEGLHLYEAAGPLLAAAAAHGTAGEDDSQGYMLSNDPALRAVNARMRQYALNREAELEAVLRTAADPEERRAAAALLGYTRRSASQASALSAAMADPDAEVRNNAVRALAVLSAGKGAVRLAIDVTPLVRLLYSGSWTDRNKSSLLLLRMTDNRDAGVLASLRTQAMAPLMEGALWDGVPGHSMPFLLILGRIGRVPDQQLEDLLKNGDRDAILSAVLATGTGSGSTE